MQRVTELMGWSWAGSLFYPESSILSYTGKSGYSYKYEWNCIPFSEPKQKKLSTWVIIWHPTREKRPDQAQNYIHSYSLHAGYFFHDFVIEELGQEHY